MMKPPTLSSREDKNLDRVSHTNTMNIPNFVKNVDSGLFQQDIFNKGAWDGNLFSAGMDQVLSDVGFFHHTGAEVLSGIHHVFKQTLQYRRGR